MKLDKIEVRGADYLYRRPGSKMIYFRKFQDGEDIVKSTRCTDLEAAKKVRDRFVNKLFTGHPMASSLKADALIRFDEWIDRKRILKKAPATITSMLTSRSYFEPLFAFMCLQEITAKWWETEYIPYALERSQNPNRKFFNDRKYLRMFLKQMVEDDLLDKIPNITNPDPPTKAGRAITNDESQALVHCSSGDIHLAILMALTMGMRRGEITNLRWDRVDLRSGFVSLKAEDTKTRKPRKFGISPVVLKLLRDKPRKQREAWVFPHGEHTNKPKHPDAWLRRWRALKKETGIACRFHDLRHTFLTNAFRAGGNPATICTYAGLSLDVAQRVYLHFTDEDSKKIADLVKYE